MHTENLVLFLLSLNDYDDFIQDINGKICAAYNIDFCKYN